MKYADEGATAGAHNATLTSPCFRANKPAGLAKRLPRPMNDLPKRWMPFLGSLASGCFAICERSPIVTLTIHPAFLLLWLLTLLEILSACQSCLITMIILLILVANWFATCVQRRSSSRCRVGSLVQHFGKFGRPLKLVLGRIPLYFQKHLEPLNDSSGECDQRRREEVTPEEVASGV